MVIDDGKVEALPLARGQRQVDADGLDAFTCEPGLPDGAPDLLAIARIIVDDQDCQGVTGGAR
jgi:hypothetical protein